MTVAHMWFDNQIIEADTTEDQTGNRRLFSSDVPSFTEFFFPFLQAPSTTSRRRAGRLWAAWPVCAAAPSSNTAKKVCPFSRYTTTESKSRCRVLFRVVFFSFFFFTELGPSSVLSSFSFSFCVLFFFGFVPLRPHSRRIFRCTEFYRVSCHVSSGSRGLHLALSSFTRFSRCFFSLRRVFTGFYQVRLDFNRFH